MWRLSPEIVVTLQAVVLIAIGTIPMSFTYSFADRLWGVIVSGIITGSALHLPILIVAIFAGFAERTSHWIALWICVIVLAIFSDIATISNQMPLIMPWVYSIYITTYGLAWYILRESESRRRARPLLLALSLQSTNTTSYYSSMSLQGNVDCFSEKTISENVSKESLFWMTPSNRMLSASASASVQETETSSPASASAGSSAQENSWFGPRSEEAPLTVKRKTIENARLASAHHPSSFESKSNSNSVTPGCPLLFESSFPETNGSVSDERAICSTSLNRRDECFLESVRNMSNKRPNNETATNNETTTATTNEINEKSNYESSTTPTNKTTLTTNQTASMNPIKGSTNCSTIVEEVDSQEVQLPNRRGSVQNVADEVVISTSNNEVEPSAEIPNRQASATSVLVLPPVGGEHAQRFGCYSGILSPKASEIQKKEQEAVSEDCEKDSAIAQQKTLEEEEEEEEVKKLPASLATKSTFLVFPSIGEEKKTFGYYSGFIVPPPIARELLIKESELKRERELLKSQRELLKKERELLEKEKNGDAKQHLKTAFESEEREVKEQVVEKCASEVSRHAAGLLKECTYSGVNNSDNEKTDCRNILVEQNVDCVDVILSESNSLTTDIKAVSEVTKTYVGYYEEAFNNCKRDVLSEEATSVKASENINSGVTKGAAAAAVVVISGRKYVGYYEDFNREKGKNEEAHKGFVSVHIKDETSKQQQNECEGEEHQLLSGVQKEASSTEDDRRRDTMQEKTTSEIGISVNANTSRTLSPILPDSSTMGSLNATSNERLAPSGTWNCYLFGMIFSNLLHMSNRFFPGYLLNICALVVYIPSALLMPIWKIRNRRIEYDAALLLNLVSCYNGSMLALIAIYPPFQKFSPLLTAVILSLWNSFIYRIFMTMACKVTTTQDTLLLMFPIAFVGDMFQMVLFTEQSTTGYDFALMLLAQELFSIFANSGLRAWIIHKFLVTIKRQKTDMNPFQNARIFHEIGGRASVDTMSEFSALGVIFFAVLGDHVSFLAGASGKFCSTICHRNPDAVFERLLIVGVVKVIVAIVEHYLRQKFVKDKEFGPRQNAFMVRFTQSCSGGIVGRFKAPFYVLVTICILQAGRVLAVRRRL